MNEFSRLQCYGTEVMYVDCVLADNNPTPSNIASNYF